MFEYIETFDFSTNNCLAAQMNVRTNARMCTHMHMKAQVNVRFQCNT